MISYIYVGTRNVLRKFILSGSLQDTATVTIKDLNYIAKQINNQMYFRPIDFILTHNNQSNPTVKLVMSGDRECEDNCNCSSNDCGCPAGTNGACGQSAFPILDPPVNRISTGIYHLNFALNHPDLVGNRGIAVWPAALANVAHRITVSKMVNNVITISTYDNGVLSDTVLDETTFAVKLYVK